MENLKNICGNDEVADTKNIRANDCSNDVKEACAELCLDAAQKSCAQDFLCEVKEKCAHEASCNMQEVCTNNALDDVQEACANDCLSDVQEAYGHEQGDCQHCGSRHKPRSAEEQKALLTRLRKIEGQIRGIQRMVEEDSYCPDILTQVSAATSALNSFNKVLLASHIRSCVAEDIRAGKDETIDELCSVLQKLMK